jgi:hypothetical protein
MKPGDLRRWKTPWEMPALAVSSLFLILRVGDHAVDFLANGIHVRGWRYEYIIENSEPVE